ncbi:putative coiled-coil protein SlyX [Kineosphaera limosa]|uniref:hypothetical protein n=1 Tax=Kineosphaera limosa TaxID=111564 RepID=UPI0012F8916D|nr:hypothetical protein [Kineosphaera limosa]NYE02217.1 putative coiled-coil protein SlyX [Kineosphaera limosa]
MSDYGAPIPPLEPRPDHGRGQGHGQGHDPQPPATMEELRRIISQQQADIAKTRSRSGWILVVATLAMFGACGTNSSSSSSPPDTTHEIQQLQQQVEQSRQSVDELTQQVKELEERLPAPRPSN